MTHDLWASLNDKILEFLSGVSLADLVASQREGKKILCSKSDCPSPKQVVAA